MPPLIQYFIGQFFLFTLVLSRISGLVMTAPIFGTQQIPATIRAFLAFGLALLVTPLQTSAGFTPPGELLSLSLMIAGELLIGVALGVGISILLSGVELTGQIISQMSGMSLADVFNPGFDENIPVFSQFLNLLTLSLFAILGGHRMVLDGLLGTFARIPPGASGVADSIAHTVTELLTQSFVLGIRAAAPAMVALLLSTLVLGFISRTLPQLNIIALGFSLSALVTFGTLLICLSAIVWVFIDQVEPSLEMMLESFQARAVIG
ncbi:MAG TPA: flagellar biosynthetic protein FliR [Pirellulales bacterium]|jgi:flagellar biosynthetic protein FliR|nr:flagellar biosynthetic protein FliR [Pirellulales bacterium]